MRYHIPSRSFARYCTASGLCGLRIHRTYSRGGHTEATPKAVASLFLAPVQVHTARFRGLWRSVLSSLITWNSSTEKKAKLAWLRLDSFLLKLIFWKPHRPDVTLWRVTSRKHFLGLSKRNIYTFSALIICVAEGSMCEVVPGKGPIPRVTGGLERSPKPWWRQPTYLGEQTWYKPWSSRLGVLREASPLSMEKILAKNLNRGKFAALINGCGQRRVKRNKENKIIIGTWNVRNWK